MAAMWVGLAITLTVVVLALVGAVLPLGLQRKDGTWRASATFVTAAMGAAGVALYLSLSIAFVGMAGK
jgi:hypothetical protein